jgi:SEC-C motif domain protein
MPSHCPCNTEGLRPAVGHRAYSDCCEPYLSGSARASTAEALMRSRYTAFCRGHIDYLLATRHPQSRQTDSRRSLRQSIQQTQWMGLTVLDTQQGQPEDSTGVVEFVAAYRDLSAVGFAAAEVRQLHERSRFVKEAGQWFYVDGESLPPVQADRG